MSLAPYNSLLRDYGRCAMACFAATYAQGTVPFFSLDTPRNVTLTYNSDLDDPRPFIALDVTHGGDGSNLPQYFTLKVAKAGGGYITFLNGQTELHFAAAATYTYRLGGQFDAAANSMASLGVYGITVIVGAQYTSGYVEATVNTRVVIPASSSAPGIARGWSIAGIQRLQTVGDSARRVGR